MSFEKIISIPGMSGLYRIVAQMRNGGFVVEGLNDNKRVPVSAMQRIIMLKDIAVYTVEEDMPLIDVFRKMKEQDAVASAVSPKADAEELKVTLKKLLPEFDDDRVHASDIRKMFAWYGMLKDIITDEEPVAEAAAPVAAEEAPAKKTTRKKKAADTEAAAEAPATEEAPKKKARKTAKSEG